MQSLLLSLATTPAPQPTPSLREGITQDQVTPGLLGFIMTAFFVVATALLIVDMVRRIRRVRYRAQVEEERIAAASAADIEAAEAAEAGSAAAGPLAGPADGFAAGSASGDSLQGPADGGTDAGPGTRRH
ncbi:putative uncharacterized protein [Pseudarthrobacter siccitolerans]|uniref:Uncharacterized protein n=1 Tax=Pseudarthrobacter siccitolerans TaxID=861266 RepID=A0A024H5M6_9MICC|nr:hypothetical protein [Pseudarthrobacter siccitolerans]CCQ47016.1 putative uncharacterized protein [Pseudarthrobacter siccitolerans]